MKVKAYELMIFNFVMVNGEILLLDKWEFKAHVIEDECKNIVPIPLDEYWLVKFGLTKGIKRGQHLYYVNMPFTLNRKQLVGDTSAQFLANCEYVHEIQNLYFALTGEELKVI